MFGFLELIWAYWCIVIKEGKDIFILGKGPTLELNHTLAAETQYSINFTWLDIRFCLNPHYTGSNSFLFVNATKLYQFKANTLK